MRDKYVEQVNEILAKLSENQILYLLTLMKKLFGSH